MSDRHLVISSDCHAGLRPEAYRDYLDPQYHEAFDQALPIQIAMTRQTPPTRMRTSTVMVPTTTATAWWMTPP